ncbi:MAG: antitoxin VapB family protein [Candidatus Aenigmatarchaeota archaeon]|mgnify:CR=1 FL=1
MSKNVALSDEAVNVLERLKRSGESYSDVVKRVAVEKPAISNWRDSIGVFKEDKDAEKAFDIVLNDRHIIKKRKDLTW